MSRLVKAKQTQGMTLLIKTRNGNTSKEKFCHDQTHQAKSSFVKTFHHKARGDKTSQEKTCQANT